MSERRTGHDQFRNLFKAPSKEQTTVKISAGHAAASTRSKNSTSPFSKSGKVDQSHRKGGSRYSKSAKSHKKGASHKKKANRRAPSSNVQQSPSSNKPEPSANDSHRRASVSPHAARTPRTPQTPPAVYDQLSRPRTPKKPSTGATPAKWNGQDVQEKTQMCMTVFENDAGGGGATIPGGGTTTTGGGEGQVQLAAAKIKERKLQWKKEKEESPKKNNNNNKVDPKQPETSGSKEEEKNSNEEKKERHEAARDKTITIFENDDQTPAEVKEEKCKLQWAPGAQPEVASEPPVRKKNSGGEAPRAISERPPRDKAPVKPPRHQPSLPKLPKTPVKTPRDRGSSPAHTAPALSPGTRPMMLEPTSTAFSNTNPTSITGSVGREPKEDPAEKMMSCYLAPTLQHHEFNSAELLKKEGEDAARKKQ